MIRFALIVASTLGFVLTAALGNLMTPLLRAFRVQQEENEPPTMGGLCLMVGTLAAVGVGWTAACVAQPELLGTESLLTTRLLIALFGALCFGAVGLADDVVRLRHRSPLGLRRPVRLALEAASGTLVLALLGLNHCLPDGLALPGVGYCTLGPLAPVVWLAILVALAESALTALNAGDGARHDALVADAALHLKAQGAEVIALAQFSLARARNAVAERTGLPVLTTVDSAVRKLRRRLDHGKIGL